MPQLATILRPNKIEDIIGQEHLTGPKGVLTAMMRSKSLSSMILYGPPGTGKTSIAHALSGSSGLAFNYFNASTDPKKKLQDLAKNADPNQPQIILLDEIHRLDKPKQDFLLPYIEDGSFVIVGATTENPYISMNPALRSRTLILQVFSLKPEHVEHAMQKGLDYLVNQYNKPIDIDAVALDLLMKRTNGDVRHSLNALEFAYNLHDPDETNVLLSQEDIENVLQQKAIDGDKDGDAHYDLLSAFQKSIRGSDVDATLHYMARLIDAGDLVSIVRRMRVIAFEDIGIAQKEIWSATMAATEAALSVGFPEANIPLAAIAVELALSPKSNTAYVAIGKAIEAIQNGYNLTIPAHLKDTHYKGAVKLGHVGYEYPHDVPYALLKGQSYLPDEIQNHTYLNFKDSLSDQKLKQTYYNIESLTDRGKNVEKYK